MTITFSKWNVELKIGWRIVALNWEWPREPGERFGFGGTWYDGPHKWFMLGPVNLYWNWGKVE